MDAKFSVDELNTLDDNALKQLDWKSSSCLNGRLLELHAEGALGNESLAKLPLKPILCIDQISRIDEEGIEASFRFPETENDWPYQQSESLEMLFQDQLDQLVGFWGARKANGVGRALSSGKCQQYQSLDFSPGKTIRFSLQRRKWVENQDTGTATAVFNGQILDEHNKPMLETKNVIVGILPAAEIAALRERLGGTQGIEKSSVKPQALQIPIFETETINVEKNGDSITRVSAVQKIQPGLWPFQYHFKGDPVVPGNFGTHGMIALLKLVAQKELGIEKPQFNSIDSKRFSGMIFEDSKQIRFELLDVIRDSDNFAVAKTANLYLENKDGERMIDDAIYTYKNIKVK